MKSMLHHLLSDAAESNPRKPALSFREHTFSYEQTWLAACAAAAQLQSVGVKRGDRIAIFIEKRIETASALFAVSMSGGLFIVVNPLLKPAQVQYILNDSGAKVLITSDYRLQQLRSTLPNTAVKHVIVVGQPPAEQLTVPVSSWQSAQILAGTPIIPNMVDIDPVGILYTSGSTGSPKGVVVSHRNLLAGAESVATYLRNSNEDVILSILPISFDAGLSQITTAFQAHAHCVLMNYVLAQDVPNLCLKHGVTGLTCVPPLWSQLVEASWPETAAKNIRYFANTGGRMPRSTLDRLRRLFPKAASYLMYGLTEAFRSTYLDPAEVDRRPDSIGKAIPNAEVLVLRPDGTECAPAEEGELVHRGPLVTLGYWNDPERTAERFRTFTHEGQSWRNPEVAVWSGDTVRADDEGFLYFVGRQDEMIKSSGYRISPTEVEEAACGTGLVKECVAMGVADESLGQRIVLVATPTGDTLSQGDLTKALRRQLPLYMLPTALIVLDSLPRSPNGKYDRHALVSILRSRSDLR